MLTKRFFIIFQLGAVGLCVVFASVIGSIQSYYIIKKLMKGGRA